MADIPIPQPSMALNSHNVPGVRYRMWNTWNVSATDTTDHIIDWIASVASSAEQGRLKVVVINCHGYVSRDTKTGGYGLSIGSSGIRRADTSKFARWRNKVSNIWIIACQVARISDPGTSGDGDGNLFLSEIAKESGAYVVGSTWNQSGAILFLQDGYIDGFEGLVLRYEPVHGSVDWAHDYSQDGIFTTSPTPPIAVWREGRLMGQAPAARASMLSATESQFLMLKGRGYLAANVEEFTAFKQWYFEQTGRTWTGPIGSTDDPRAIEFGIKRYLESIGTSEPEALVQAGAVTRIRRQNLDANGDRDTAEV